MTPTINKVPAAEVATISDVVMIFPGTIDDTDVDDVVDERLRSHGCGVERIGSLLASAAPGEENARGGDLLVRFCLIITGGT
jgi:hypothetical protein